MFKTHYKDTYNGMLLYAKIQNKSEFLIPYLLLKFLT